MFNFTDKTYLNVLIVISIIMVIRYFGGIFFPDEETDDNNDNKKKEGFEQSNPFVLKQNEQVFEDTFYSEIYDKIYLPSFHAKTDITQIIQMTQPSKTYSCFLDIGSGTGSLLNELQTKGYRVYGIDKSQSMVDYTEEKYPDVNVKCGDVNEPMAFERGIFTHILCSNFTIYHFENKIKLFRNIYHWLSPGGYLFLHLVDPSLFDTIIPSGKPNIINTPQKYAKNKIRITETVLDFKNFKYKSKYDFSTEHSNKIQLIETFTDEENQHVRQYEQVLFMEPKETILFVAQQCGFILHSQSNYSLLRSEDPYQYLIILERPM
jgi:SAM-dependent methyltransferase